MIGWFCCRVSRISRLRYEIVGEVGDVWLRLLCVQWLVEVHDVCKLKNYCSSQNNYQHGHHSAARHETLLDLHPLISASSPPLHRSSKSTAPTTSMLGPNCAALLSRRARQRARDHQRREAPCARPGRCRGGRHGHGVPRRGARTGAYVAKGRVLGRGSPQRRRRVYGVRLTATAAP